MHQRNDFGESNLMILQTTSIMLAKINIEDGKIRMFGRIVKTIDKVDRVS